MRTLLLCGLLLCTGIGFGFAGGCRKSQSETEKPKETPAPTTVSYEDIAAKVGIHFQHYSGAQGKKRMPETVGSGVAFLDYNNDGKLDILFINSTDWPENSHPRPHSPALYRNNGDGTFTDVTAEAGLKIDVYGMGVCVGDYDNDGYPDIFLTCVGPNHLFHNNGNGTFTDVTAKAGVAGVSVKPGGIRWKWSSSATFCDYNKDGIPDLFVCNYVKWTPETDVFCTSRGGQKAYCAPTNFEGVACTLYRGKGDGTFEDVSEKTGILPHVGRSLGVVVADIDGDGWPDIIVTNDTTANFLFINDHGERFREEASEKNFALPENGSAKAGMGIDIADFENNGHFGLLTGNFARECLSLYENDGSGNLRDQAYPLGVAQPSLPFLTFGLFFFDFDLDGRPDIFTANGHIDNFIREKDALITYEERPLLFHNEGGKFREIGLNAGPALQKPMVGRGCAWGDIEGDGNPVIALVSNNDRGYLFRNMGPHKRGWLGLKLHGVKSTRDGWGGRIRVTAGGRVQNYQMAGGGSFLSQHQPWPLFGLNGATEAESLEIDWPSGEKTALQHLPADHYYEIVEGRQEAISFK